MRSCQRRKNFPLNVSILDTSGNCVGIGMDTGRFAGAGTFAGTELLFAEALGVEAMDSISLKDLTANSNKSISDGLNLKQILVHRACSLLAATKLCPKLNLSTSVCTKKLLNVIPNFIGIYFTDICFHIKALNGRHDLCCYGGRRSRKGRSRDIVNDLNSIFNQLSSSYIMKKAKGAPPWGNDGDPSKSPEGFNTTGRSKKKVRMEDSAFSGTETLSVRDEEWMQNSPDQAKGPQEQSKLSYRDTVRLIPKKLDMNKGDNVAENKEEQQDEKSDSSDEEDDTDLEDDGTTGIKIETDAWNRPNFVLDDRE
ncbi:uncharacterized protein G2W53_001432 [Senna tora]|uniref:Uncharacterized protein n=1 Tax=Senna tora TaxID=362788 RepID=A0A834XGA2_9FABA|nr:uncharacterized protein G2W53_001432 [Senna tora]